MAKRTTLEEFMNSTDFSEENDNVGLFGCWLQDRGRHHTFKFGHVRQMIEMIRAQKTEIIALREQASGKG